MRLSWGADQGYYFIYFILLYRWATVALHSKCIFFKLWPDWKAKPGSFCFSFIYPQFTAERQRLLIQQKPFLKFCQTGEWTIDLRIFLFIFSPFSDELQWPLIQKITNYSLDGLGSKPRICFFSFIYSHFTTELQWLYIQNVIFWRVVRLGS